MYVYMFVYMRVYLYVYVLYNTHVYIINGAR